MIPFLKEEGCGFLDAEIDKKILARGFKHTSKGAGFMDYQDIPDVLMWMTEGGLWKSAAVSLLREIEVGGELGNMKLGGGFCHFLFSPQFTLGKRTDDPIFLTKLAHLFFSFKCVGSW